MFMYAKDILLTKLCVLSIWGWSVRVSTMHNDSVVVWHMRNRLLMQKKGEAINYTHYRDKLARTIRTCSWIWGGSCASASGVIAESCFIKVSLEGLVNKSIGFETMLHLLNLGRNCCLWFLSPVCFHLFHMRIRLFRSIVVCFLEIREGCIIRKRRLEHGQLLLS